MALDTHGYRRLLHCGLRGDETGRRGAHGAICWRNTAFARGELLMGTQKFILSQEIPNSLAMATNVTLVAAGRSWEERTAKRLMDVAFGTVGSFLTFLITPLIALLLKWEDGGPVFYAREFVDCDGSVRHYLKFRTMVINAEERLRDDPELKRAFDTKYKLQADPRVLRTGRVLRKYSIDECPQFFSILTGKLTLVGPRVIS